jgi:NAD(P)-dependent dehydrogenase (short-subunit alcohol dehydrogenase family)
MLGAMQTWTLVTDALVPGGRQHAAALAARGKDLVLLGDMRSVLEELAAELRVVHRVDVRILAVDLAEADAAARVVRWLDEREMVLDGVVSVGTDASDPVRAAQVARQLAELEAALEGSFRHRGFGGMRRVSDALPRQSRPPRRRRSVVPPGSVVPSGPAAPPGSAMPAAADPGPRRRASTAPGYGDPSSSG